MHENTFAPTSILFIVECAYECVYFITLHQPLQHEEEQHIQSLDILYCNNMADINSQDTFTPSSTLTLKVNNAYCIFWLMLLLFES